MTSAFAIPKLKSNVGVGLECFDLPTCIRTILLG